MRENVLKDAYLEEAHELLAELEISLLELEETPDDMEVVGKVFRAMHTIKGSGSMFGFDNVAAFTHEIETVLDHVRNGDIAVTKELIDLTLKGRDCIRTMLENKEDPVFLEKIRSAFKGMIPGNIPPGDPGKPKNTETSPSSGQASKQDTYLVRFRPHREMFSNGTNPVPLFKEIAQLGSCSIVAQLEQIPDLQNCDPEQCYTYWDIVLTTDQGVDAIKDVFIFVEDIAEIDIKIIDEGTRAGDESYKKLGEILVERGDIKPEILKVVLNERKKIGEELIDRGLVFPDKVESALAEQEQVKRKREKQQKEESISSIRVPAQKLDILVDLVGELVTLQARISRKASTSNDPDLLLISEQVERLTEELRDNTMSIRMLPIGTTFGRFKRLVRDLSSELGKEIELLTEGAETELDKTVIEKLNDPLVHIIRNSIDHGIEMPQVRESVHKPKVGKIRLSAIHSGAYVIIEIKDDGKGLDKETILAKAIEKGLVAPNTSLTDEEIFGFIFNAGFSTASKVTNVSGRGVGMDVVKKAIIDSLKGSIDVKSEAGMGTTVTIKLPLTLAIIEGLLVTIENRYFVLPLSVVEECVQLTREDTLSSHGRNMAHIRGEIVPYIRLRKELDIPGEIPEVEQIVVTGANGSRVGFVVDNVIGQHQTVIKTLGKVYKDVEGISGATILGDGTVALIVDTQKLLQGVELAEAFFG